jgi:hypothetical protein
MTLQQSLELFRRAVSKRSQAQQQSSNAVLARPQPLPCTLSVIRNRLGEGFDVVDPAGVIVASGFDTREEAEAYSAGSA